MSTTVIPPKPDRDPDVHLRGPRHRKPRTLKGDLAKMGGKAASVHSRWSSGKSAAEAKKEKVRDEGKEVLKPVKDTIEREKKLAAEVMKPVYKAIGTVRTNLDPANGKTRPYVTSFMISSIASWLVGPQILVAAYERVRFGSATTDWGFLMGPGRWFRDTVGMAHETGQMSALVWAAVLGLMPMIILGIRNMGAGHVAQGTYQGRMAGLGIKWLTRAAYLIPVLYLVGISYPGLVTWLFGSPWTMHWWQVWVMALFCLAYYCTMWVFDRVEKGLGLGYFHVLLMMPVASIVTGAVLYAPGAAW